MAWCRAGDKPLLEPMMDQVTEAYASPITIPLCVEPPVRFVSDAPPGTAGISARELPPSQVNGRDVCATSDVV